MLMLYPTVTVIAPCPPGKSILLHRKLIVPIISKISLKKIQMLVIQMLAFYRATPCDTMKTTNLTQ